MPLSMGRAPVPGCGRTAAPRPSGRPGWTAPGRALPLRRPLLPGRWASGSLGARRGGDPLAPPRSLPSPCSVGWGRECHVLCARRSSANAAFGGFQRCESGGLSSAEPRGSPWPLFLGKGRRGPCPQRPLPCWAPGPPAQEETPPSPVFLASGLPACRASQGCPGWHRGTSWQLGWHPGALQPGGQRQPAKPSLSFSICQDLPVRRCLDEDLLQEASREQQPPMMEVEDPSPNPLAELGFIFP